ncbi:hypothetical protein GCM10009836_51730 [Pseudonocardia ailaonensis]|uniref:Uncharacterized protein n=1 Tax=Pseudonocardia ailaonensis TaxID=367279 RepID=A0ABN2NHW4_9PSEU
MLDRSCLVPPGRDRGSLAAPPARLPVAFVATAAALMVVLAVGVIVSATLGAPVAVTLVLAAAALAVRPVAVLVHRRR